MSIPTPPPMSPPLGRNPAICENGKVICNEPLTDETGKVVGYCSRHVWPPRMQTRFLHRPGHPGKPHTVTWWPR